MLYQLSYLARFPDTGSRQKPTGTVPVPNPFGPATGRPGRFSGRIARAATSETPREAAFQMRCRHSGGGIRTRDLRVMSPTSYQTAPPRSKTLIVAVFVMGVNGSTTGYPGQPGPMRETR